jgi:hypothetical protein
LKISKKAWQSGSYWPRPAHSRQKQAVYSSFADFRRIGLKHKKTAPAGAVFVAAMMCRLLGADPSERFSPADDTQEDQHNGYHQQDVDETADSIGTDQANQPKNDEYYCNGIEHRVSLLIRTIDAE